MLHILPPHITHASAPYTKLLINEVRQGGPHSPFHGGVLQHCSVKMHHPCMSFP